jgi:long-chain acyl-CoA synthetase
MRGGRTRGGLRDAIIYPAPELTASEPDINKVAELVKSQVNAMNRSLVSYKQVRAVEIRRTEFEKTTSKKIKRHLVK